MNNLQNRSDFHFSVETFTIQDGKQLNTPERDKDGYYLGVPLAVIDTVTRNKTWYEPKSIIDKIVNPESTFNIRLTEGNLWGEWGHPKIDQIENKQAKLKRVLTLDPDKESNHYRKIYSKGLDNLPGKLVIFGDTKPSGPCGKYFEERMEDPTMNCAFSLRSITNDKINRAKGIIEKEVVALVTFDAGVPSGGYKESSKRFSISSETLANDDMNDSFTHGNIINLNDSIGFETFTDSQLCEIFQANSVTIKKTKVAIIDSDKGIYYDLNTNEKTGLFSSFLKI